MKCIKQFISFFIATLLFISMTQFFISCRDIQPEKTYKPTWESLASHPVPQWYDDAKFGIFIHWGVYSVPAWGKGRNSEWYLEAMTPQSHISWRKGADFAGPPYTATRGDYGEEAFKERVTMSMYNYHREHYGADFAYDDFIPMFKAENYNPAAWADLFKKAGARYVVLTAKHGEEFALWPTEYTERNAMDMGPKQDLSGKLAKAVRKEGMKMGFYHNTTYTFYDPRYPGKEWVEYMNNSIKELVDMYQPALLWGDTRVGPARDASGKHLGCDHWNSKEVLAYFYNNSQKPSQVLTNNRWGECESGYLGDYTTPELEKLDTISRDKWETCMTITGTKSWGYDKRMTPEDYWPVNEWVDYLVDIVSKNGNLLLNVGPRADGTIPEIMRNRLLGIGRWLDVNGEAIYGTDYWKTFGEGNIRFTRKGKNTLYAIALEWPGKQVTLQSLNEDMDIKIQEVSILGDNEKKLEWHMSKKGLTIETPQKRPCKYAYSFKIVFKN